MHLSIRNAKIGGFTLIETGVAAIVAVVFGLAAFATNQRLLIMLKNQRETTAASMMMQERMEAFRSLPYAMYDTSNSQAVGLATTVSSANPSPSPKTAADVVRNGTVSEAQLGGITGSLSETIIISGYMDANGNTPPSSAASNTWLRNAANPIGSLTSVGSLESTCTSSSCIANYDLLQVDIRLTWNGADGRSRKREMTSVVGRGNIGGGQ